MFQDVRDCSQCLNKNKRRYLAKVYDETEILLLGDIPNNLELGGGWQNSPIGKVVQNTLKRFGLPYAEPKVSYVFSISCGINKNERKAPLYTHCSKHLVSLIKSIEPKIVIPLGSHALRTLAGDFNLKITEHTGKTFDLPALKDIKIVPVESPALMQRAPGRYKMFYQHFKYIKDLYEGGEIRDPGEVEYKTIATEEGVEKVYNLFKTKLPEGHLIGADIETISLNPKDGYVLAVGMSYAKNKAIVFLDTAVPHLDKIFKLPLRFGWHGGKFDKRYLRNTDGIDVPIHEDAMLLHYCLNETSGTHDLEQLSVTYLGALSYKQEANDYIKSKDGFASAPTDILALRCAMDVDYTRQLIIQLKEEVYKDEGLKFVYENLLIPGANTYTYIEDNGMKIDVKAMNALKERYEKELESILSKIHVLTEGVWIPHLYKIQTGAKSAPELFNPGSSQQLRWVLLNRLKLQPKRKKRNKTGLSVDKDVLLSIENPPEIVQEILRYRAVAKELSTYVIGFLKQRDKNDRVHTTFNLHITTTGRRSSKEPNIQNISKRRLDIREAFIAEPGWTIMEADYKGAELRVLAMLSKDPVLTAALASGEDLHDKLSIRLYGTNFTKAQRVRAKAVNFGVPYGREAHSIAEEYDMSHSEAQAVIDGWLEMYSGAASFMRARAADAIKATTQTTPIGRKRRPGLVTKESLGSVQREFRNFQVQSVSGDFTLRSAIEVLPLLDPNECRLIDEIHDSLVFEIRDEKEIILKYIPIISRIMGSIPKKWLKWELEFPVEVEIGNPWSHLKDWNEYFIKKGW